LSPHDAPDLEHAHTAEEIQTRISSAAEQSYLGDAILGAMDGIVTTFATVSAVSGAGLGTGAAAALGLASLIADGFSMAVGNYFRAKADEEVVEKVRRMEEDHVEKVPEGERDEVREIFRLKGFEGDVLEKIVETITKDRKRWVDTMITEEWGLRLDTPEPIRAGAITFAGFVLAGSVPLVPLFFLFSAETEAAYRLSGVATAFAFFGVGYFKGRLLGSPRIRGGFETLILGAGASSIAYAVGALTRSWIG